MKPLTADELLALSKGTKVKLHPKLIEYMVDYYGTARKIIESTHRLTDVVERAGLTPGAVTQIVDIIAMNDVYDDERVVTVVDQHGFGIATQKPSFVLCTDVNAPSNNQSRTSSGLYCACAKPAIVQRTIGAGSSYNFCTTCRKEVQ